MLEVLDYMSQNNIDIFGLAETNIHWNNGETYKKQQRKLRKLTNDPKAQLITSDTNIPWTRHFKPGGTALLINSKVASHVSHKDSDYPLGRWSIIDLQHKNTKICICSAYIVGKTEICPTKNYTAAYQQWQILSKNNNHNHPRDQAIHDLATKLKQKITKEFEIILMLDANDNIKTYKGIIS